MCSPWVWKFRVVQETAGGFHPSPAALHAHAGSIIEPSTLLINTFLFVAILQLLLNVLFR